MNISGKRMLITGGSSGIGLELARAALQSGARVAITGRDPERVGRAVELFASRDSIASIVADVTSEEGRRKTIDGAVEALGGIDILINNAGGVHAGRLETISEEAIRAMVEVNLTAPILLTRDALPHLRKNSDSLIVNVSSGIALVGIPFYAPYAAVKAGIAHFGEALRRELADEGVRVLTVYPTATETPMMATSGLAAGKRESAADVAREVLDAMSERRLEVVRGDWERQKLVALNKVDQAAVDAALRPQKATLEQASRGHSAL